MSDPKQILGLDLPFKVIDNAIPKEFIELLLKQTKDKFTTVHTNVDGVQYENTGFRTDSAYTVTDINLSNEILNYIIKDLPDLYIRYTINPLLRFTKSKPGNTVAPHTDSTNNQEGYLSIILYLSDNRDGATRFFNVNTMKYYDVLPKVGRVTVFDHRFPHAGLAPSWDKYIMRTNVNGVKKLINPTEIRPEAHVRSNNSVRARSNDRTGGRKN